MAHKTTIATKEKNERLDRAILALETEEECYAFFQDLCTIAELRAMEQRFEVAMLLLSEGMIYNDILERTGASSATISRVNRSLQLRRRTAIRRCCSGSRRRRTDMSSYEGLAAVLRCPDHGRGLRAAGGLSGKALRAAAGCPSTRCWIWPAAPAAMTVAAGPSGAMR